jgi:CBS domain-containing protein
MTTLASDLMSRPVRRLTSSTPVRDAAAFLLRHGISGAAVVDAHGRWVGVFTQTDLARHVQEALLVAREARTLESREPVEEFGETPVRDLMTQGMFTVFPDATLDEVVRAMVTNKVHRIFVIDPDRGELEGVITSMDVLRILEKTDSSFSRS